MIYTRVIDTFAWSMLIQFQLHKFCWQVIYLPSWYFRFDKSFSSKNLVYD